MKKAPRNFRAPSGSILFIEIDLLRIAPESRIRIGDRVDFRNNLRNPGKRVNLRIAEVRIADHRATGGRNRIVRVVRGFGNSTVPENLGDRIRRDHPRIRPGRLDFGADFPRKHSRILPRKNGPDSGIRRIVDRKDRSIGKFSADNPPYPGDFPGKPCDTA